MSVGQIELGRVRPSLPKPGQFVLAGLQARLGTGLCAWSFLFDPPSIPWWVQIRIERDMMWSYRKGSNSTSDYSKGIIAIIVNAPPSRARMVYARDSRMRGRGPNAENFTCSWRNIYMSEKIVMKNLLLSEIEKIQWYTKCINNKL